MIITRWICLALALGVGVGRAADEVAEGPWTWTTEDGECFRAVPFAQAYDSEAKELVFVFRDEAGGERRVAKSRLVDGEAARFGTYQREHRRLEAQRQAVEEARQKQLAEDRTRAEAERKREEQRQRQAAMEQRLFTLKDGGQVTGKRINEFNEQQQGDMLVFLTKLTDGQRQRFNVGIQRFMPIIAATRAGDEGRVLEAMQSLYGTNAETIRAVDWVITNTPAGTTVIPCDDGRGVEWEAAWQAATRIYAQWVVQQGRR